MHGEAKAGRNLIATNDMTTIEAKILEPVLKQAKELAKRENLTQAVGVWSNESYVASRAKRASRAKFSDALKKVPDVEPPDYDRSPEGYSPAPGDGGH